MSLSSDYPQVTPQPFAVATAQPFSAFSTQEVLPDPAMPGVTWYEDWAGNLIPGAGTFYDIVALNIDSIITVADNIDDVILAVNAAANAADSATAAAGSATASAGSAQSSSDSATIAANSSVVAQTAAGTATDAATTAMGAATTATNAATAATGSATAAAGSAATANLSELASTAAWDNFRGTWYGPLPNDPFSDPLGNPPTVGDVYFNTTRNELMIYNGAMWASIAASAISPVDVWSALVAYGGPYNFPSTVLVNNSPVATAAMVAATYVPLAGGTMQGPLLLYADAAQPLQAVTFRQMQAATGAGGGFLPLTGGTLTGPVAVVPGTGWVPTPVQAGTLQAGFLAISGQSTAFPGMNIGFNMYSDGTVFRTLQDGYAGTFQMFRTTGVLNWNMASASATAGSVASPPTVMSLTPAGALTLNGISAGPGIAAGSRPTGTGDCLNIWATASGDGGILAVRGPTYPTVPNAVQIYAGPASARKMWDFRQDGNFYPQAHIVMIQSGALFFDTSLQGYISKSANGDAIWQIGSGYYMGRIQSNGSWVFVENNTINFTFDASGNLTCRAGVSASNLYLGVLGNWLTSFINQPVLGTSQPTFNNVFVSALGNWISVFLNQGVLTTSWPTFAGLTTSGGITMAGRTVMQIANAREFSYVGGTSGPTGVTLNGYDAAMTGLYGIFVDAVSDIRVKENIVNTDVDALACLLAIPVRQYDVKAAVAAHFAGIGADDETRQRLRMEAKPAYVPIGMVTQEVEPHVPEAVHVNQLTHDPDSPLPDDAQTLRLNQFVPYLVRGIQQLNARLVALEKGH